jgi:hypothetical protein
MGRKVAHHAFQARPFSVIEWGRRRGVEGVRIVDQQEVLRGPARDDVDIIDQRAVVFRAEKSGAGVRIEREYCGRTKFNSDLG